MEAGIQNQKGILIIGIILMITTIGFLGSMVLVDMLPGMQTSAINKTYDIGDQLRVALDKYRLHHGGVAGTFPTDIADLIADDGSGACAMDNVPASGTYLTLQGWCGPYLDLVTTNNSTKYERDGWGNDYSYDNATGIFYSFGPDQTDDTGGNDDISFNP